MNTSDLGYFDKDLAVILGLDNAIVLNKMVWCSESDTMTGTTSGDGSKYIRNPIVCTNPNKIGKGHSKFVDWLANFPYMTKYRLRKAFKELKELGLITIKRLRAAAWDQCNYYAVNFDAVAELVKPKQIEQVEIAPLSICRNSNNRYIESQHIDMPTVEQSYQDTYSEKVIQEKPLTERAGATVSIRLENKKEESSQSNVNFQVVKEVDLTIEPTALEVVKCSAPSGSVERKEFFEALLTYCYQRVDIDSPEGYANWVMKEFKARTPEASVAMLWDEFNAGEELGGRMVPPGFRLRGVPEQVVIEAISQDCLGKVGATATEAAKNAAGQLRRLPVVAAVTNAVKLQLERCLEGAKRQVELGVPKEQALLNSLPIYATNCTEKNSMPQIAASETVKMPKTATDPTNPYALTEENRAARSKAFEAIQAVKAVSVKLPKGRTKREQILAANMADAVAFASQVPARLKPLVEVAVEKPIEDEPILW